MSTGDLLYSDTEQALRDSVRHLFADRCPPETGARAYDPAPQDFSPVWRTLSAELGVAGLLVPESLGGAGAGAREAAVVMEEVGRAVAPVPFLSSAVLATVALLKTGETQTLLSLADGSTTGALTIPLSTPPGACPATVRIGASGLTGRLSSVAGADAADVLVVPVAGPDGLELHTVSRAAAGVKVAAAVSLDMTRPIADVEFSAVASTRIDNGAAEDAVAEALLCGAVLLASEQVGVAQWCLETTLGYVKERKQFGRAVGSFQALKHRLADLWLQVGSAGATARYAAATYAPRDAAPPIAAAVAQAYCSDVAVHAAEECIQHHGGIGMTWEYPAHLYLKRAKSDQLALGTAYRHRARLADLIDLPPVR